MNYYRELSDEELLEKFGVTYGKLVFDRGNSNLTSSLEKCKQEILYRISNKHIANIPLSRLVTDEKITLKGDGVDETATRLFNEFFPNQINLLRKSAKIIVVMDNSGSMGSFEKYMGRAFMLWNTKIIEKLYGNVRTHLIAHHTEATEIYNEDEFYTKGESGGTIISSGLNKVNEIVNSYDYYNEATYVFIIGDGDNLTSDNERSVRILDDLQRKAKHICYYEINQYNRTSTFGSALKDINYNNLSKFVIREKEDLYGLLRTLWQK